LLLNPITINLEKEIHSLFEEIEKSNFIFMRIFKKLSRTFRGKSTSTKQSDKESEGLSVHA